MEKSYRTHSNINRTAIRHIVWDWNGTLLDDAGACVAAVDALMRRRGLGGETFEGYRSRIMFPVREYYRIAGFDLSTEDYGALCDEFGDAYGQTVQGNAPLETVHRELRKATIHNDAVEVLAAARSAGISHAIVSASEEEALYRQVEQFGLSPFFTALMGRNDNHAGAKDHLVRDWVARCGFHRDQILFVGDAEHDFEAASAAGIRVALVADGHVMEERLHRLGVPVYPNRRALWRDVSGMTEEPVYRSLRFETDLGEMGVVTDNLGLVRVELPGMPEEQMSVYGRMNPPDRKTWEAAEQIKEWLAHPQTVLAVPASPFGTGFRRAVWQAVRDIPAGHTESYGHLALRLGKPGASRAVAQALRDNPIPLVVPCHRVVGADGTPTGFMGIRDNPLQQKLLDWENGVRT